MTMRGHRSRSDRERTRASRRRSGEQRRRLAEDVPAEAGTRTNVSDSPAVFHRLAPSLSTSGRRA